MAISVEDQVASRLTCVEGEQCPGKMRPKNTALSDERCVRYRLSIPFFTQEHFWRGFPLTQATLSLLVGPRCVDILVLLS
ncbi:hypothetical protein E2C01_087488 [Portunus trituberculatus]|uniref:Uncharacterized protein n=1 Tax=Portunus trituberculatus TaxID=210409 RepID=A0A5B7J6Q0_PORTR|nr:hypothetical protein [Portunus trituberculatus]